MPKPRDLAALVLALSTLVTSVAALVKALYLGRDAADTYQQTALTAGEQAGEVQELRERLDALEKETRR